jgi:hypothetical protein
MILLDVPRGRLALSLRSLRNRRGKRRPFRAAWRHAAEGITTGPHRMPFESILTEIYLCRACSCQDILCSAHRHILAEIYLCHACPCHEIRVCRMPALVWASVCSGG